MAFYNKRLAAIAGKLQANGQFGKSNLDQRYYAPKPFDKGTGSLRNMMSGIKIWFKLEWRALWLSSAPVPVQVPVPQAKPAS
jgi:hypothetical protein